MRFLKSIDFEKINLKKIIGFLIVGFSILFIFEYSRSKIIRNENIFAIPKLKEMAAQKVLVVKAEDSSENFRKDAYLSLYKILYALKKDYPKIKEAPIRVRFTKTEKGTTPNLICYALPILQTVSALPVVNLTNLPLVRLETWDYGTVAQILYKGPHAKKTTTLERLFTFIEKKGYSITNGLEEEYRKGPGLFFEFNPQKYQTILRFRVTR
jgi:effector-binding domain-containing protein